MKKLKEQKIWLSLLVVTALVLSSCGQKQVRTRPGEPTSSGETRKQSKSVALVLGGAGIASFATIGLLKKFKEEGIEISYIVSTGWPSIFALGYGFLKSVHDAEWFAMRLRERDFYSAGLFDFKKGYADHKKISSRIYKSFKSKRLNQSKIPIYLTATNTQSQKPDVYSSGGWNSALLKSISLPGIFRPYPANSQRQWVFSLNGVDVSVAKEKGADIVIAVNMYDDYLRFVGQGTKNSSESVFRELFLTQFKGNLKEQLSEAHYQSRIYLRRKPTDFSAKRTAIHEGYKVGTYLVNQIRSKVME